jgi:hypothetical protein
MKLSWRTFGMPVLATVLGFAAMPALPVSAAPATGPLIEVTQLADGSSLSLNITASYAAPPLSSDGVPFVDPVTGDQNVYGLGFDGDIIEYTRLPPGNWITYDVTSHSSMTVSAGTPAPFVDTFNGAHQVVFVTDEFGDLLEYIRTPSGTWSADPIGLDAAGFHLPSPRVLPSPRPFVDPLTGFQNVYVVSTAGQLLEFARGATTGWGFVNLSTAAGGPSNLIGSPVPFVDPLTHFQNVYATTANHHLVEFTRLPAGNWISLDINAAFSVTADGGTTPAPFVDPVTGLQDAYVVGGDGHLDEYTRFADGHWSSYDVTGAAGGPSLRGDPAPWAAEGLPLVYASSATGIIAFRRDPVGKWSAAPVLVSVGGAGTGDPEPFVDPVTSLLNIYAS